MARDDEQEIYEEVAIVPEEALPTEEEVAAENRIAESMGPTERSFRDRYAHLVNAHREQAKRQVELEGLLTAALEGGRRADVAIAQGRAELASAREDKARLHATLTDYYDELFLEHLKLRQTFGAVLATLPRREASIPAGDTRWTAVPWPSPVAGITTYRAVRAAPEPVASPEEDEEDEED